MESLVNNIEKEIELFLNEMTKGVQKKNASACRRARKSSLNLEKLMKEFRKISVKEVG